MKMNSMAILSTDWFSPDFIWTIGGVKKAMMEQGEFQVQSQKFGWRGYPVSARARLQVTANGVYVCLDVQHEEDAKKRLNFKAIPSVFYVLKDQTGKSKKQHIVRISTPLLGSALTYEKMYVEWLVPASWLAHPAYNVDDSICIEIYVEPAADAEKVSSYEGVVGLPITGFRKRLWAETEGCVWYHEGPCVYTGPRGYRVRVNWHLTGYGERAGRGLSAMVCFLPGAFDWELPVNFPHQTTITIYNRKCSFSATVERDLKDGPSYVIHLCRNEDLDQLLEGDSLNYIVKVSLLTEQIH